MSVKFKKESMRTASEASSRAGKAGKEETLHRIGEAIGSGKEETLQKIGEAVTGGKSQTGYLAVQLSMLTKIRGRRRILTMKD